MKEFTEIEARQIISDFLVYEIRKINSVYPQSDGTFIFNVERTKIFSVRGEYVQTFGVTSDTNIVLIVTTENLEKMQAYTKNKNHDRHTS